ncbi:unnamed protein product [Rhizoctonia solani]|uniref:AIG1-type G domain-containing protein n=1 Tax=Rhizoctonia solani TaxID=456999 RepID=A0A8H2WZZ5_9AGAM|nr:unnamed protein product [Rhizoctonia solani]
MARSTLCNLRVIEELLGQQALQNLVFVTNMWDSQPDPTHDAFEKELIEGQQYFASAMEHGARAGADYRIPKNASQAEVQDTLSNLFLYTPPVVLQIQREMVDDKCPLKDTHAGRIVDKAVETTEKEARKLMGDLKEELANLSGEKESYERWIKSDEQGAKNRVEQAKKQREFLQLTLEFIQEHPYLSAFVVVVVVAAGAGVIMFGGKVVVISKFTWKAKMAASVASAATASAIPTSTATGAGVGVGVGTGIVDVSFSGSMGLVALLGGIMGAGVAIVKGSNQDKEVGVTT